MKRMLEHLKFRGVGEVGQKGIWGLNLLAMRATSPSASIVPGFDILHPVVVLQ